MAFATEDRPVCDLTDLATLRPHHPYPAVWTVTGASADERALEIAEAIKTVGLAFLDRVSTPEGALALWSEQLEAQCSNPRRKRVYQAAVLWSVGREAEARDALPEDCAQQVLDRFAAVPPILASSGR